MLLKNNKEAKKFMFNDKVSEKELNKIMRYCKVSITINDKIFPRSWHDSCFEPRLKKIKNLAANFGGSIDFSAGFYVDFDTQIDNRENSRKFIAAFRKMFPKQHINLVTCESMGSTKFYSNKRKWCKEFLDSYALMQLKTLNQFLTNK